MAEINVETFDGRAKLSGFVSARGDMDKAVEVARRVGSLTSLKFDIAVVTRKSKVQLSSFVDSHAQIDQTIAIANKVDGVTKVGKEMSIKK